MGARSEAAAGRPWWSGGGDQGRETFDFEEETTVSDRLRLMLVTLGLKPGMDEYTVLVHRVARSLGATGLDEAAEEIRRTFLKPTETEAEGPEADARGDGDTTGPWTPGSRTTDNWAFHRRDREAWCRAGAGTDTRPAAPRPGAEDNPDKN